MNRHAAQWKPSKYLSAAAVCLIALAWLMVASARDAAVGLNPLQQAREILQIAGVTGGLVVDIGCGDGKLTAALRAGDSFLVQGLDVDPKHVQAARQHIQSLGLYGGASIEPWDGQRLPYADDLVNLVVVHRPSSVARAELLRVLCPGGVAVFTTDHGKLATDKLVKPWPKEIDEWTHYLHDASGNPVAQDRKVGPPRQLQWASPPRWCRSHETDISFAAAVSARGRIFTIQDEAPTGVHDTPLPPPERRYPDKWALVAQDAFNGVPLWKRPIRKWGGSVWEAGRIPSWANTVDEMFSSPPTVTRRLVASGDRVYITLGWRAPVTELEAATGRTLREFADTVTTDEILVCDGILLARVCQVPDGPRPEMAPAGQGKGQKRVGAAAPALRFPEATVVAIELSSGKTLWKKPAGRMIPLALAASKGAVCYLNAEGLTALELASGRQRWQATVPPRPGLNIEMGATLAIAEDKVLVVTSGVQAHALADGHLLWHSEKNVQPSFRGVPDLLVANGLAWAGTMTNVGLNLQTGAVARTIDVSGLFTAGHHPRCYRSKGTEDYLIWSKRGVEFMDIRTGQNHSGNDWVRGVCRYGVMPANGLLYVPPNPCRCQRGVQLTGFNALAAADSSPKPRKQGPNPTQGPAYGKIVVSAANPADWPTYRKDIARSGNAGTSVPAHLSQAWVAEIAGRMTPPVIAGGSLYVAGKDAHAVYCFDAEFGQQRWRYTAGGPVDSPPTIAAGRVLFGCADGAVYCLNAADGELAWRFDAAPGERTIVSYGQLESAWPVHGSVLVKNDVVYCSAGRSSFLDGGIYLYGLDVATGKPLYQRHLDGPWSIPAKDRYPHAMEGTNSDILVCAGDKLVMLQYVFDLHLNKLDAPIVADYGLRKTERHLLATGGFLDDSGFDRLYWMNSESWPGTNYAIEAPKTGQLLVYDDAVTYAFKYFNTACSRSPFFSAGKEGYDLVADNNDNEAFFPPTRLTWSVPRQKPPRWQQKIPVRARAMVLAGDHLILAGPPDVVPASDPFGSFEGRLGALLWIVSTKNGEKVSEYKLPVPPVFDGMAAAKGRLYLAMADGKILCLAENHERLEQ